MTVPVPTIKITAAASRQESSSSTGIAAEPTEFAKSSDSFIGITATSTRYVYFTQTVSIVSATPTFGVNHQELYFYTERDGSKDWFNGKTPPASAALVSSTATVIVQPIPPKSFPSTQPTEESTSYSIVYITLFYTNSVVETSSTLENSPLLSTASIRMTSSILSSTSTSKLSTDSKITSIPRSPQVPKKPTFQRVPKETETSFIPSQSFTTNILIGTASNAWNSSLIKTPKGEERPVGNTSIESNLRQSKNEAVAISNAKIIYRPAKPSRPTNITNLLIARQVGSLVIATIDGVAVSWINDFDGTTPTSATTPTAITDAATQAHFPLPSKFMCLVNLSSSQVNIDQATPTTTLAVYPWEFNTILNVARSASHSTTSETASLRSSPIQTIIPFEQSNVSLNLPGHANSRLSVLSQATPTTLLTSMISLQLVHQPSQSILPTTNPAENSIVPIPDTSIQTSSCGDLSPNFTVNVRFFKRIDLYVLSSE